MIKGNIKIGTTSQVRKGVLKNNSMMAKSSIVKNKWYMALKTILAGNAHKGNTTFVIRFVCEVNSVGERERTSANVW
ncbi:hypothetical protein THMIRHAT_20510 [Thiosulfativibrio zosterae]|uniref:Uncharacterized protein n=1 Tax=Thiosulfativibrio zosterae TaxID=2675053 RepID=A0A6F8PQB8_9GAMM|nr:hypothetical protein THMIRHAT_20510 [Thiosulfativibrio zosterae]